MNLQEYRNSDEFREKMRRMAGDMLYFGKVVRPKDFDRVGSPDFHREVVEILQDDLLKHVNLISPRGHAKSTLCARLFPLWHIFLEDIYYGRPKTPKFVVLCSRTQELSIEHLNWMKEVFQRSEVFRVHFGDWGPETARQWTSKRVELKNGDLIICKGMGQQYVGLNHKGQRPTLAVNDDLEDKTNTITDEALEKNFRWLVGDVEPAMDPQVGRVVVVGTPKHRNCIVERLDREDSGYASRRYSAILDENKPTERALWEEWKPLKDLKADRIRARRRGEEPEWVQEMLCKVTGDNSDFSNIKYWEGDVVFDAWWNAYLKITHLGGAETKGDPDLMRVLSEPMLVPVNCFLGNDPAISASRRADDAVNLVVGYDASGRYWTMELLAGKGVPVDEQVKNIITSGIAYQCRNIAVEGVSFQQVIHQNLITTLKDEPSRVMGWVKNKWAALTGDTALPKAPAMYLPGMYSKHHPTKKKKGENSRLSEMQPAFSSGKIYVRSTHTKLRDEALDYPNGPDNCLDALYYARLRAYKPTHTPDMMGEERKVVNTYRRAEIDWMTAG